MQVTPVYFYRYIFGRILYTHCICANTDLHVIENA